MDYYEKNNIISPAYFQYALAVALNKLTIPDGCFVTGPGRSGAVAAVHASHYLGLPYLPPKALGGRTGSSRALRACLVVDTAEYTGKTLRKMCKWYEGRGYETLSCVAFSDPNRIHRFWYEVPSLKRGAANSYVSTD